MRFLPIALIYGSALASDPCDDLCKRDGPDVCTQGSWNQNGVCHAYIFRGDASLDDYCYHNAVTASSCPSSGTKVRVEDAVRLLSKGTTTTTQEPLGPADPGRIAAEIDGMKHVSRPWRSHPKAHFENTITELSTFYYPPVDRVQFWKDSNLNGFMLMISNEYPDDTGFIIHIVKEIVDFLGVDAADREEFGIDSGFAAACAAKADLIADMYQTRISAIDLSDSGAPELSMLVGLCPELVLTNLHVRYWQYLEKLAYMLPKNPDRPTVVVARAKTSWGDLRSILLGSASHLKLGLGAITVEEDEYGSIEELMTLISSSLLKEESLITIGADGSAKLTTPIDPDMTQYTAIGRFLALGFLEGVATAIPFPASFYSSIFGGDVSREIEAIRAGFNDLVPMDGLIMEIGLTGEDLVALNAVTVPDSIDLIDLSLASEYNPDESARIPTHDALTQNGYFTSVYAGFDDLTKMKFWRVMTGLNWIPAMKYLVNSVTIFIGFNGDGELKWSYYNTQTSSSLSLPSFASQEEMRVFFVKLIDTAIVGRL